MKQINPHTFSRRLRQSFATGAASIISVPGNYLPLSATTRTVISERCIKH